MNQSLDDYIASANAGNMKKAAAEMAFSSFSEIFLCTEDGSILNITNDKNESDLIDVETIESVERQTTEVNTTVCHQDEPIWFEADLFGNLTRRKPKDDLPDINRNTTQSFQPYTSDSNYKNDTPVRQASTEAANSRAHGKNKMNIPTTLERFHPFANYGKNRNETPNSKKGVENKKFITYKIQAKNIQMQQELMSNTKQHIMSALSNVGIYMPNPAISNPSIPESIAALNALSTPSISSVNLPLNAYAGGTMPNYLTSNNMAMNTNSTQPPSIGLENLPFLPSADYYKRNYPGLSYGSNYSATPNYSLNYPQATATATNPLPNFNSAYLMPNSYLGNPYYGMNQSYGVGPVVPNYYSYGGAGSMDMMYPQSMPENTTNRS